MTPGFFDIGFAIQGHNKFYYQEGEPMTFMCTYLPGFGNSRDVTWNFYRLSDHGLIKSGSGIDYTTAFSMVEVPDDEAVIVEMVLGFGPFKKVFKKVRFRITPNKDTADVTINLGYDSHYTLIGGSAFGNLATADVTNGSVTVTTSANHSVSNGNIVCFIQSGVVYTYLAQPGTSGTTIILDRGFEGTTGTISNANTKRGTDIQHSLDLTFLNEGQKVHIRGMLYTARLRINNIGPNTATTPIWFLQPNDSSIAGVTKIGSSQSYGLIFTDFNNCFRWVGDVSGDIDNDDNYRFRITGGMATQHFSSGNTSDFNDVQLGQWLSQDGQSSCFSLHIDAVRRMTGAMDDLWFCGCTAARATNEGGYVGYSGSTSDNGITGGEYKHATKRLRWLWFKAYDCGWDGAQASQCNGDYFDGEDFVRGPYTDGAYMAYFFLVNNATLNAAGQSYGLVMNGGFTGEIHDVVSTERILHKANSHAYIHNVILNEPDKENMVYIFRGDNSRPVGVDGDYYDYYDEDADIFYFDIVTVGQQDPFYMLEQAVHGGTPVPLNSLHLLNISSYFPNPISGFLRYNQGNVPVIVTSYVQLQSVAEIGWVDANNTDLDHQDYRVPSSSPTMQQGIDVSQYVDPSVLRLKGFYDITGQQKPVRGRWRRGPYCNPTDFNEPDFTKTSITWYQTNENYEVLDNSADVNAVNGETVLTTTAAHGASPGQGITLVQGETKYYYLLQSGTTGTTLVLNKPFEGTTGTIANANAKVGWNRLVGPSDKEQLVEMYTNDVDKIALISGSDKPRIVGSVNPKATTGSKNGLQYFDTESY